MSVDPHFPVDPEYVLILLEFAHLPDQMNSVAQTTELYQNFFSSRGKKVIEDFVLNGWKFLDTINEDWIGSAGFRDLMADKREILSILKSCRQSGKLATKQAIWLRDFWVRLEEAESMATASSFSDPVVFITGITAEKGIVQDESSFNQLSGIDQTLKPVSIEELDEKAEIDLEKCVVFRCGYPERAFYDRSLWKFGKVLADGLIAYLRFYFKQTSECQNQECENIFLGRGKGGEHKRYCSGKCRTYENRRKKKLVTGNRK